MSRARLVITAVVVEKRPVAEVVAAYGMSRSRVYELLARYRAEGEAAFEPKSRRPHTSPSATPATTVETILRLRKQLSESGLDAGAETIGWHLRHRHDTVVSRATINRVLVRHAAVTPDPSKRPRSSYIRFEASMPNETWQSDFTHYPLTDTVAFPKGVEIITWLDDHSRYLLHVSAHPRITGPIVVATFTDTAAVHGYPASTLTDNGMVYTTRFSNGLATGRHSRNGFETLLRDLDIVQKNSRPNHPTTCGKVERVQQTLKKWLRAQPDQPATVADLQSLLDGFVRTYNDHRPHRSLPNRATPATVYTGRPKAVPSPERTTENHHRVRADKVDGSGCVTLRVNGRLHHIGIGRPHARTHVLLLVEDLAVRIIDAATGELLRDLVIDPTRDYQGTGRPPGPAPKTTTAEPTT
ncbi:IS481 family transposase [Nocardioides salarius]|uniref:IS481 family transposase n=1 Tax=Nocardioides salarius TaxID=374513 RepID=UPI0030F69F71